MAMLGGGGAGGEVECSRVVRRGENGVPPVREKRRGAGAGLAETGTLSA